MTLLQQSVAVAPATPMISRQMIVFLGALVISLVLTFYDEFDITRTRAFLVVPVVLFATSLFLIYETPGFTVLMFFMLLLALRKEYTKNNAAE